MNIHYLWLTIIYEHYVTLVLTLNSVIGVALKIVRPKQKLPHIFKHKGHQHLFQILVMRNTTYRFRILSFNESIIYNEFQYFFKHLQVR